MTMWNYRVHRAFPGKCESSNLSRDGLSREIVRNRNSTGTDNGNCNCHERCASMGNVSMSAEPCMTSFSPPRRTGGS